MFLTLWVGVFYKKEEELDKISFCINQYTQKYSSFYFKLPFLNGGGGLLMGFYAEINF